MTFSPVESDFPELKYTFLGLPQMFWMIDISNPYTGFRYSLSPSMLFSHPYTRCFDHMSPWAYYPITDNTSFCCFLRWVLFGHSPVKPLSGFSPSESGFSSEVSFMDSFCCIGIFPNTCISESTRVFPLIYFHGNPFVPQQVLSRDLLTHFIPFIHH